MAKLKPQLRRLMHIDGMIREGMKTGVLPNATTIARKYQGVSSKTIQRDIAFLKYSMKAPIEYDDAMHGYQYTEESWSLPYMDISESDLFAVAIAEKALQMYENTPLYDKLATIFDKIEASLPERVSVKPSWLGTRFSFFKEASTTINPAIWETVFEAIRDDRTLQIEYQRPVSSEAHQRDVDPYHAVAYRGEWYVIGYCHYRKKIITFAISRMKSAKVLNKTFAIPTDFDFDKFIGPHFGIMHGEKDYQVKIKFTPAQAPYIKERQWHPSQAIKEHKDGSITLSFTANALFEVKRWILGWGSEAKVLAPKELVEMVKEELKEAVRAYA